MFKSGEYSGKSERRKTSHITDNFRQYLSNELSRVMGMNVGEKEALTIFKLCYKYPMRFLITIEEKDFDQRGERAISVPGVGKFKFMNTIPQGKKIDQLGADGKYPRFKWYPTDQVESEVEHLHGIGTEESEAEYAKAMSQEEKSVENTKKEIAKELKRVLVENGGVINQPVSEITLSNISDVVKDLIEREVAKRLKKAGKVEDEEETNDNVNEEDGEEEINNVDEDNTENNDVPPVPETEQTLPQNEDVPASEVVVKEEKKTKGKKVKEEVKAEPAKEEVKTEVTSDEKVEDIFGTEDFSFDFEN